jgi:putative transposase
LEADLEMVCGQYPTYGTRRITHQLKRHPFGYEINRKQVQQIMRRKKLLRPIRRKKCWTTDSNHPYPRYPNLVRDMEITKPDQVWVSDATYIRLGKGFVYLAMVMDVFTRSIRGWELSKELDQQMTISALQKGLQVHCPEIHHSDQGVQYAARAYVDILMNNQIKVSMSDPGKPEQNGYAERLMRTIKEEEVDLAEYSDFADAKSQIGRFIEDVYQHKRIHSSLGYLTPVEYEAAFLLFQVPPKVSK